MEMISFVEGNIADKELLKDKGIDTIVNAANPTLMGSDQGVDGAIHKAIYELSGKQYRFCDKICEEMGTSDKPEIVRCRRGQAQLTSGYGLCNYVIHVVGAEYDGTKKKREDCSSSKIQILESCYSEIVTLLKKHIDIRRIAIPIIGAGRYGFPFELAVRIAVASVSNALIEWEERDPELFAMAEIEEIYFFICDPCIKVQREHMETAKAVLREYEPSIRRGRKVVFQKSIKAHFRYMAEIKRYDGIRGYFSVAKNIRWLLMLFRVFFLPFMWLKDVVGGSDWKKRRCFVEILALVKMVMPVFYFLALSSAMADKHRCAWTALVLALVIYAVCDTMSYLLTLIIMSDIQRPSANIIRSILMLFVNYIEVSLDMALLYWIAYRDKIGFADALLFGVLGERQITAYVSAVDYVWPYMDAGIRFFFMSLVFGYLANHMRQRKFRS